MRRPLPLIAALWLLLLPAVVGAGPTVEANEDGLVVTSSTTYEVFPEEGRVHVIVDATATSLTPNTATHQIFYSGMTLPVHPDASAVQASAGGVAIDAGVVEITDHYQAVEISFGREVFFQQSYAFRLTFDLVDAGGAPERETRIRPSFVAFPVWAFGTERATGASVEVRMPAGYSPTIPFGVMRLLPSGEGATRLVAEGIDDPPSFFAYVTGERPGAWAEELLEITVGGTTASVQLLGWPDDPEWSDFMRDLLTDGLPAMSEAIGLDYPIAGTLSVSEHAYGRLGNYAGVFNDIADTIQVRYDVDAFVGLHETAHIWFNGSLFEERWIGEAFASHYAETVGTALGHEIAVFDLTPDLRSVAFPLNAWEGIGVADLDQEDYAYAATHEVGRLIARLAGEDELRTVWRAAHTNEFAYAADGDPSAETGEPTTSAGWQRLLDLLENRTDADFGPIWREWIVTDDQLRLLDQRQATRLAYEETAEDAAGWSMPRSIRLLMGAWQFDDANHRLDDAEEILDAWRDTVTVTARLGLTPPATVRSSFESGALDAAAQSVRAQDAALDAIGAATNRTADPVELVELLGLIGSGEPDSALEVARDRYEAGELDAALDLARAAEAQRDGAAGRGRERVALVGGGLLMLDAAAMGALALAGRRRADRLREAARVPEEG
ncbi:MAG: hypothetical protein ACRDGV_13175 [Candidatus Limnocylindria bacterium]